MNWLNKFPRWIVWAVGFLLLVVDGWLALRVFDFFHTQLTIFFTAILLSFVLNYPVQWFSQLQLGGFRLKRSLAVLLVLLVSVSVISTVGLLLVPLLIEQVNGLYARLPSWLDSGLFQAAALESWAEGLNLPLDITRLTAQFELKLTAQLQSLSASIFSQLPSAVSTLIDVGLTVVLTAYLLIYGEKLWDGVFQWLPESWNEQSRPLIKQNFQNYFVGQITVALLLGSAITTAFLLIKVPFGLLFGLAVGGMALFPFGGSVSILVIGILTGLKSIWLGARVIAVGIVVEQVVANAIAPQLIGGIVGLNPVWILVSLLLGTKIAGVLGLIVAVPVAGSIKSLFEAFKPATSAVAEVSI